LRSCETHKNHCYINGMRDKLNSGSRSWSVLWQNFDSGSTPAPEKNSKLRFHSCSFVNHLCL